MVKWCQRRWRVARGGNPGGGNGGVGGWGASKRTGGAGSVGQIVVAMVVQAAVAALAAMRGSPAVAPSAVMEDRVGADPGNSAMQVAPWVFNLIKLDSTRGQWQQR